LADDDQGDCERKKFYLNPTRYIECMSPGLNVDDVAILFTMDRDLLAKRVSALAKEIDEFEFSGDWPPVGDDWTNPGANRFYDPSLPNHSCPYPDSEVCVPPGAGPWLAMAGGGGAAWADPGPHGRGVRPASLAPDPQNQAQELLLVGEGFLDRAVVTMTHVDPYAPNGGPHTITVASAAYANFRRSYLKCEVVIQSIWPKGRYVIKIYNDPNRADRFLTAGHFFRVE